MTKADELLARIAAEDEALMTDRQRAEKQKVRTKEIVQHGQQYQKSGWTSHGSHHEEPKPTNLVKARQAWGMEKEKDKPAWQPKKSIPLAHWTYRDDPRVHGHFLMSKTYQEITPKSAEDGEPSETGFEYENHRFDSLWDLAKEMRDEGASEPSGAGDWYTEPHTSDYQTGTETSYGYHAKGLTPDQIKYLDTLLEAPEDEFRKEEPKD